MPNGLRIYSGTDWCGRALSRTRNTGNCAKWVRYRRSLIEERSREGNRVQKVLEGANIKLSAVASDVLGVSGRAMIEAMIRGVTSPEELAGLAKKKLKEKKDDLVLALDGVFGDHQKQMLSMQLRHVDEVDAIIELLDQWIAARMQPIEEAIRRLDTIPGNARTSVHANAIKNCDTHWWKQHEAQHEQKTPACPPCTIGSPRDEEATVPQRPWGTPS